MFEIETTNFWIKGVLTNIVGIFGLIGNIIAILILKKKSMKSSINYILLGKNLNSISVLLLKFSFSEKATKIFLMVLTFTIVKVKIMRKIAQILVTFSEKLNFISKICTIFLSRFSIKQLSISHIDNYSQKHF